MCARAAIPRVSQGVSGANAGPLFFWPVATAGAMLFSRPQDLGGRGKGRRAADGRAVIRQTDSRSPDGRAGPDGPCPLASLRAADGRSKVARLVGPVPVVPALWRPDGPPMAGRGSPGPRPPTPAPMVPHIAAMLSFEALRDRPGALLRGILGGEGEGRGRGLLRAKGPARPMGACVARLTPAAAPVFPFAVKLVSVGANINQGV